MRSLEQFLGPLHERRARYTDHPDLIDEILAAGNEKARKEASITMQDVRAAMHM